MPECDHQWKCTSKPGHAGMAEWPGRYVCTSCGTLATESRAYQGDKEILDKQAVGRELSYQIKKVEEALTNLTLAFPKTSTLNKEFLAFLKEFNPSSE